jgi:probable F420-dependent oxidoreductase
MKFMKIDAALPPITLQDVPRYALAAEKLGFDALWASETQHDPFLPGPLIAEHTHKIHFGTAVAIGFARSPGTLAYTAWDLAQASNGRFILGLGTQVRGHIERRFGMPWPDSVVGKLREQVSAIRALWHTWQSGERLSFKGDYYRLNLMTPFFDPGPIQNPEIPIYIAGVNTGLAGLAGECADGFHVHPLNSQRYLQELLVPAIARGAQRAGRSLDDVQVSVTAFVVTSPEEKNFIRMQIAFYASTPSYRRVFSLHGWENVAEQLTGYAARRQWGEMGELIDDAILETFAVVAAPEDVPAALMDRYHGLADRLTLYTPLVPGEKDGFWETLVAGMQS